MTRMPALWTLLTGKLPQDPRDKALSDYMAACVSRDTRKQRVTLDALRAATTAELARGVR